MNRESTLKFIGKILESKINKRNLKIEENTIITVLKNFPKWFHYRATKQGQILLLDLSNEGIQEYINKYPKSENISEIEKIKKIKPFEFVNNPNSVLFKKWKLIEKNFKEKGITYEDSTSPKHEWIFGSKVKINVITKKQILQNIENILKMPEKTEEQKVNKSLIIKRTRNLISEVRTNN